MDDNNYIGNISTIIKVVSMGLAGYAIGYAAAHGLNLPIDQVTLSQIIGTVIMFAFAYVDAKYPNSFAFLGNDNIVDIGTVLGYPAEESVMNDEYTTPLPDDSEVEEAENVGSSSDDGC